MNNREKVLIVACSVLTLVVITNIIIMVLTGRIKTSANVVQTTPAPATTVTTTPAQTSNNTVTTDKTTTTTTATDTKVIINLSPGYNLISIPYRLVPNDGKTLFANLTSQGAYFLGSDGVWSSLLTDNGQVRPGEAYWVKSAGESFELPTLQAQEVDSSKAYTIHLRKDWNAVGNPFNKNIIWNPKVKTSKGMTTYKKAVENKMLTVGYRSDPLTNQYKTVNAGDTLKAFSGLLIKSGGEVDLILSAD